MIIVFSWLYYQDTRHLRKTVNLEYLKIYQPIQILAKVIAFSRTKTKIYVKSNYFSLFLLPTPGPGHHKWPIWMNWSPFSFVILPISHNILLATRANFLKNKSSLSCWKHLKGFFTEITDYPPISIIHFFCLVITHIYPQVLTGYKANQLGTILPNLQVTNFGHVTKW